DEVHSASWCGVRPSCGWLPGHALWMHTGWCTAVAWRPARRAACLHLPLEGAGLVLGFAGCLHAPMCTGALHPLGELLISAVFQNFSGLEIDLHGVPFPARSARCSSFHTFNSLRPRGFALGCVLQRCTCGCLCSPLTARSCRGGGE